MHGRLTEGSLGGRWATRGLVIVAPSAAAAAAPGCLLRRDAHHLSGARRAQAASGVCVCKSINKLYTTTTINDRW